MTVVLLLEAGNSETNLVDHHACMHAARSIYLRTLCLLIHLTINPLFAVDNQVPGEGSLEELLVVLAGDVELLVLVRLPVGGDVDDGNDILTTEDEGTGDDGVVGLAEDTNGTEEVLPGSLETVEETADLVAGHEGLGELLVILEVDSPDGESLVVEAKSQRATHRKNKMMSLTSCRTMGWHPLGCQGWSTVASTPQG